MQLVQGVHSQCAHRKGISGSTLKMIAILSMILDHIGAIILERMLLQNGMLEVVDIQTQEMFLDANASLYTIYMILRIIGRVAFPIFCFLVVQGFLHTHNLKKYLSRLLMFALVSEVPFDLAFSGKLFDWTFQNVFFTLFIGVITIASLKYLQEKEDLNKVGKVLLSLLVVCFFSVVSTFIKCDYGMLGVLSITVMYVFRKNKMLAVGIGCVVLLEFFALCSLIPIYFYNEERGRNIKWLFYMFYPVHISLLYLIACAMGLAQIVFTK